MTSDNTDPASGGKPAPRRLTAAEVRDYLNNHPGFLAKYPDVLTNQDLRDRRSGSNVIDFQTAQVERLRDDNTRLRSFRDEVLEAARSNIAVQTLVHDAVLSLLDAVSFEQFIHTVTLDLANVLGIDVVTLCVEESEFGPERPGLQNLLLVPPGTVDALIGSARQSRLMSDMPGDIMIFGPAAPLVRSQALVRIDIGEEAPMGLIAFGSRMADKYDQGQGSEFLVFLGQVAQRLIRLWLRLSE
jgi:uncharacterized protein